MLLIKNMFLIYKNPLTSKKSVIFDIKTNDDIIFLE